METYKRKIAVGLVLLILVLAAAGGGLFWLLHRDAPRLNIRETPLVPTAGRPSATDILAATCVIAHGTGELDGHTLLNCLESFQASYDRGVRVFEVDLRLTADGAVVLRHDWSGGVQEGISEGAVPTLAEFLAAPVLGQYTPLSWQDLLRLMEAHPDICVVTDSKFTDSDIAAAQFGIMTAEAEELGLRHLFDRVVVQFYNRNMHAAIAHAHRLSHYIYTLYNEPFSGTVEEFEEIAAYCALQGVEGVTMWDSLWDPAFLPIARAYGLRVYVHTVNDPARAAALLAGGVSGIYTDRLTDAALGFRPMDRALFRMRLPKATAAPSFLFSFILSEKKKEKKK